MSARTEQRLMMKLTKGGVRSRAALSEPALVICPFQTRSHALQGMLCLLSLCRLPSRPWGHRLSRGLCLWLGLRTSHTSKQDKEEEARQKRRSKTQKKKKQQKRTKEPLQVIQCPFGVKTAQTHPGASLLCSVSKIDLECADSQ